MITAPGPSSVETIIGVVRLPTVTWNQTPFDNQYAIIWFIFEQLGLVVSCHLYQRWLYRILTTVGLSPFGAFARGVLVWWRIRSDNPSFLSSLCVHGRIGCWLWDWRYSPHGLYFRCFGWLWWICTIL